MNTLKTTFIMVAMMGLFMLVGNAIAGERGMIIALIFSLVMNFGSYWFSDKIVLSMYGANRIEQSDHPQLYNMVANLADRAEIPMPKVYIINSATPNAFATGRNPNNGAVAITTGIMEVLNFEELEGVVAHELAHIKNRDILVSTISATLVGTITQLTYIGMFFGGGNDREGGGSIVSLLLMLVLAPVAATLLQLAISRSREYGADEGGATISGKPLALASALHKLSHANEIVPMDKANPATSHMFIVNPLRSGGISGLFSTHPPMEKRIERLQDIASGRI